MYIRTEGKTGNKEKKIQKEKGWLLHGTTCCSGGDESGKGEGGIGDEAG